MDKFKAPKIDDCQGDISKAWFVYFSVKNPDTGKFTRFRKYVSNRIKTKSERYTHLQELKKSIYNKLINGWSPFSEFKNGKTIIEAVDYVIKLKKTFVRYRSIQSYKYMQRIFYEWIAIKNIAAMDVAEFTPVHAREFLDWCKMTKGISNRTYNNYLNYMKLFFSAMVEREFLPYNPFTRIKKMQNSETGIIAFTQNELALISKNLPAANPPLWIACQLIYYCFIRPQELLRLRIEDIELSKRRIKLSAETSKNKKMQYVIIPDQLINVLSGHIDGVDPAYYLFSASLMPGRRQMVHNTIARAWRVFADKHKIKKPLYAFKHTGAGKALEAGINVRDLQLQLRHHSLDMTQVYLDRFKREPGDKISRDFPSL